MDRELQVNDLHECRLPLRPPSAEFTQLPVLPFRIVHDFQQPFNCTFAAHLTNQADAVALLEELCGASSSERCELRQLWMSEGVLDAQRVRIVIAPMDSMGAREIQDLERVVTKEVCGLPRLAGRFISAEGVCFGLAYEVLDQAPLPGGIAPLQLEQGVRALLTQAAAAGLRCWKMTPKSLGITAEGMICVRDPMAFLPVESAGIPQIERDLSRVLERFSARA